MLYDLNNILDGERFKRRSNDLYKKKAIVELTEKKRKRTLSQNSYLHYLLGYYAMETGNTIEYVIREYFKRLCNPSLFLIPRQDKYLGEVNDYRSSAVLSTAEMTQAIERFRNWSASECGIYLPSPDEEAFLQSIELELERHKDYL